MGLSRSKQKKPTQRPEQAPQRPQQGAQGGVASGWTVDGLRAATHGLPSADSWDCLFCGMEANGWRYRPLRRTVKLSFVLFMLRKRFRMLPTRRRVLDCLHR